MEHIIGLLLDYSYLLLFLGVVAEGEVFPLAAGFLVSTGHMELFRTLGVTFIGVALGDMLWFGVARKYGRALVDRWGKMLFLRPDRVAWLEQLFERNGKKTLFITKFIYSFGHSSIVMAGIARMSWREFLKVDVPASALWACLFVLLGKTFGNSLWLLSESFKNVGLAALIVVAALVLVQVLIRRKLIRTVR